MKLTMKLLVLLFGVLMLGNAAYAETPREQFKLMVEQLQKSPDDNALREKIIKFAQGLKPALSIPEEARRAFVRGNTAFSEAKGADDYARAVQRYEEALVIAPWWGDPYFNLAKALELRQEYSRAIQSLKLFVFTGPSADDARKAQDYSYALEDKLEKLTKEKAEHETVARAEEAKYGWLLGKWSFTMRGTRGYTSGEGVLQAEKSDKQILIKKIQSQLWVGNHALGKWSGMADFLRGTIGSSGEISWEENESIPNCFSTNSGWIPVNVNVSTNQRTIQFIRNMYSKPPSDCTPSNAGNEEYSLTHN